MFTLEIGGKAVAVTNAAGDQARELFLSDSFRQDLISFRSAGRPLWDGSAHLMIRAASEDEIGIFDAALEEDDQSEEEDRSGLDIDVVFLVTIDAIDDHEINR